MNEILLNTENMEHKNTQETEEKAAVDCRALVRRIERLAEVADKKAAAIGGWKKNLPTRRGLWFHAVWQSCGYFHVQRFPVNSTVKYLRAQNNGLWGGANAHWLGPFPKQVESETWTRHVNPPNHRILTEAAK